MSEEGSWQIDDDAVLQLSFGTQVQTPHRTRSSYSSASRAIEQDQNQ